MTKPTTLYINKTKVVLFPIKSVRSVEIDITMKCGSWYETGENWGAFHFLEHMILQGTKKFPSSEKISEFTKENGIHYNAFTSREKISLPLNIPDVNLNKGLQILEEVIFNPIISILGFFIVGLGFSVIVPEVYRLASKLEGVKTADGVSFIAATTNIGFLVGPVMLGYLAELKSLHLSFIVLTVFVSFAFFISFWKYKKIINN